MKIYFILKISLSYSKSYKIAPKTLVKSKNTQNKS